MEYDKEKYKVSTWKNWVALFWIINPLFAVVELLLGIRIPKVMLRERNSDKPKFERGFIPCPHCGTCHDSRTWSGQNGTAFKNWFGLYCPECGKIIPCLTNVCSFVILVLTYPVWFWLKDSLKEKWLQNQAQRFQHLTFSNPFEQYGWIKFGFYFALFALLFEFILAVFHTGKFEPEWLGKHAPSWIIAGLFWGFFMKYYMGRKTKQFAGSNKNN